MIRIKRAYEQPARGDGHRVLVDRLWPRGVSKATAHVGEWLKDLAPSDQLRKWFAHDPERFPEFRTRYRKELSQPAPRALLRALAERARRSTVTLVYAAHDEHHNNAVVLASLLKRRLSRAARTTPTAASRPGT